MGKSKKKMNKLTYYNKNQEHINKKRKSTSSTVDSDNIQQKKFKANSSEKLI